MIPEESNAKNTILYAVGKAKAKCNNAKHEARIKPPIRWGLVLRELEEAHDLILDAIEDVEIVLGKSKERSE